MDTFLLRAYYLLGHYAWLCLFVCAFWGIGAGFVRRIFGKIPEDPTLVGVMAVALGQGLFVVALQGLAVNGLLQMQWILLSILTGLVLAIAEWCRPGAVSLVSLAHEGGNPRRTKILGLALLLIFASPTLLESLRPPWMGDELQYHLPHVQQWAESGALSINAWIRYPWFPFNYNLLYASAYVVFGDVFTHMFNTLAGWLVAVAIYRLGVLYFSQAVACVATFIWFHLNRGEFGVVNVDMGLTLYALTSFLAFFWWMQNAGNRKWIFVSAFLLGVALGTKYQALFFLPIFSLALVWTDKRFGTALGALICLLLPCIYWYGRNALMTGDPFDPIGGKIFGFSDWNLADYNFQFADLKRVADWPKPLLWPAVFASMRLSRRLRDMKVAATVLCLYFFLVWMVTSHYSRYLMPVVPLLALLAAEYWCLAFGFMAHRLKSFLSIAASRRLANILWTVVFAAVLVSTASFILTNWSYISPTIEMRNALMRTKIKGFTVLEYARAHRLGNIYNAGMGDVVYYAPHPVWGDVFGPWRYSDVVSPEPEKFYNSLKIRNFDAAIVGDSLGQALESSASFGSFFVNEFESDGVRLYLLKSQSH